MGFFYSFLFPWNLVLQAIAIIHFIRRRPDSYWLWIILIGGWIGALVYIFVEVLPDAGLLRQSFKTFPRRRRIHELPGIFSTIRQQEIMKSSPILSDEEI